jgi:antitoxin component YwqK of YwqJK toxin-antitoxin module
MNTIKKTLYLLLLILIILDNSYAQKSEKFYNYKWEECNSNIASFYSLVLKTDSGYLRKDYFLKGKNLQSSGLYSDSLCKVKNGLFTWYHANGILESRGKYVQNKAEGIWKSYYENGFKDDSALYHNGKQIGTRLSWYPNGYLRDSTFLKDDGSGVFVSWFDNGILSAAGRYSEDTKQNGVWKYYHKNRKISSNEIYFNSKLTDKRYYNEQGELMKDTANTDRIAQFNDGMDDWLKYITDQIEFPEGYKIVNSDSAIVVITCTINEEGNVENVFVSIPFDEVFDDIVVNAIKKSPKWMPAISHNRKVKCTLQQAVIFKN